MRVLVVGGAGHVGSIIRSALEQQHACRYFDLRPVPGAEDRTIVADVNDDPAVAKSLVDVDALVYLAMGKPPRTRDCSEIDGMFIVNVIGFYRFLWHALHAGVRRIVYASSLSVYQKLYEGLPRDESIAADSFAAYGVTKRLGEQMCLAGAQQHPDATIVALRLMFPQDEEGWAKRDPSKQHWLGALGPQDTRRLFLAAVACNRPGAHIVQASGDTDGQSFPNTAATELLDWRPLGD